MKRIIACLLVLGCLSGCGAQTENVAPATAEQTATIFAMDTVMELRIYGEETFMTQAEARISELESRLSVTVEGSEIYQLNQTGTGTLSEDAAELLSRALDLCVRTNGALDISLYPVIRAWGFTTGDYQVPSEEKLASLLARVDHSKIQLDGRAAQLPEGMEIDLGSVAKGYTGDQVLVLLRQKGVSSALLNLGGNVQALGAKPDGTRWNVAVQDPAGEGYLGTLEIEDQAVITSGGYERYFEQDGNIYWHILDPATGKPAKNGLTSVTVVGDSGLVCDGLSTALFVMGAERAAEFWRAASDFEAIFVNEQGNITITEGLETIFTPADDGEPGKVTVLRRD